MALALLMTVAQDGHEWGTFTAVAGADGVAFEWRLLVVEEFLTISIPSPIVVSLGRSMRRIEL
jgi:hypothetical protein